MDVPSPKFSSALGDMEDEDDEKNELIRSILHNDPYRLRELLKKVDVDIT